MICLSNDVTNNNTAWAKSIRPVKTAKNQYARIALNQIIIYIATVTRCYRLICTRIMYILREHLWIFASRYGFLRAVMNQ